MADKPSFIYSALAVDPPLVQNAPYRLDAPDRQYIDTQIRGLEQHLVDSLIRSTHETWARVDGASATLNVGDVVCGAGPGTDIAGVILATPAALAFSRSACGIVTYPGAPGALCRFARGGIVLPKVTGLTGTIGYARISTTGRVEFVGNLSSGDFPLGTVDALSGLNLLPGPAIGPGANPVIPTAKTAITQDVQKLTGLTSTSAVNIWLYTVPAQSMVEIWFWVEAIRTDVTNQDNATSQVRRAVFRRIGTGVATQVSTTDTIGADKSDAGISLTVAINTDGANTVRLQVNTASGQTLDVIANMMVRQVTR